MDRRDASNEYEFIRQTFEGTIYEENYLRKTLTGQIPHIQANYLSRLLLGYTDVDLSAENKESLRFMNLTFISDRFTILLAKIEDIQYFAEEGSEQQWALARFIVSNVGVDLIEQGHKGFAIELEQDRIAFIINLVDEQEVDHEADIRGIAKMLYGVITQKFNINLTLAVGDIHQGMKAIRNSYPEALAALEYRLILGKNSIIHFKDIIETKQHYYYPLEVEIQLTNLVRSGDTVNVEKLLERVFAMNFNSNHITPELGKCLFFNLTSTLLKIINSTNVMQDEVFGDEMDPIKVVFSDTTVQGMQMKVKELYETLTRSLNVERTDHNIQLLQAIIDLVNDKIGDPELGLAMIADSFQMTQPYISTFFKKNQGQNLQDYIMSKRMESAKRLMEDKELTISQIAQRVGYNDVVFIRAFKKLEGIPPGKYRETMLPDKSNSGK